MLDECDLTYEYNDVLIFLRRLQYPNFLASVQVRLVPTQTSYLRYRNDSQLVEGRGVVGRLEAISPQPPTNY